MRCLEISHNPRLAAISSVEWGCDQETCCRPSRLVAQAISVWSHASASSGLPLQESRQKRWRVVDGCGQRRPSSPYLRKSVQFGVAPCLGRERRPMRLTRPSFLVRHDRQIRLCPPKRISLGRFVPRSRRRDLPRAIRRSASSRIAGTAGVVHRGPHSVLIAPYPRRFSVPSIVPTAAIAELPSTAVPAASCSNL
jgi:hypothetical protein